MRISPSLLNSHSYPWLTTLKSSQLQRIAQATGIQSSGTKTCLITRLKEGLPGSYSRDSEPEPEPGKQITTTTCASKSKSRTTMSILSIDMGIQNLAYAHLLVERDSDSDSHSYSSVNLNAWRRLAVSDLDTLSSSSSPGKTTTTPEEESESESTSTSTSKQKQKQAAAAAVNHTFSPSEYARTAYALVNSLLHRYQPSHVLIERQRFRTGGGSAVQEWTLRVGVFEGMLYAVLYALGRERQLQQRQPQAGGWPGPVVLGVESRRVGAYWEDRLGLGLGLGSEGQGKGKRESKSQKEGKMAKKAKKAKTASEGKKAKINLAGEWLRAGMGGEESGSGSLSSVRLSVADEPELRALVDAYLARWAGKSESKPKTSGSKAKAKPGGQGQAVEEDDMTAPPDVRKMDDLADCLVQGVTWLEWQAMRQRISTEGLHAVSQLESGKL